MFPNEYFPTLNYYIILSEKSNYIFKYEINAKIVIIHIFEIKTK